MSITLQNDQRSTLAEVCPQKENATMTIRIPDETMNRLFWDNPHAVTYCAGDSRAGRNPFFDPHGRMTDRARSLYRSTAAFWAGVPSERVSTVIEIVEY